ncbi:MAG: hypothetical protein RL709_632, partial [Pseudomonadota bacterium]
TCKKELPLNEELKTLPIKWDEVGFQTKDLENCLLHYTISEDGRLLEHIEEREYVHYTEEERKQKGRKPWDLYKDVIIKNKYDKEVNHHGVVNFYTSVDYTDNEEFWVEFNAYFIYGKLDRIELFKCDKQKSRTVYNQEWEEKRKVEEQKLWNRTKKILRYIGWGWFWNKMSKYCYNLSRVFSKIQTLIIRNLL